MIKIYLIKRDQHSVQLIVNTLHVLDKLVNFTLVKSFMDYMKQLRNYMGIALKTELNKLRLRQILPYPEEIEKIDRQMES